MWIFKGKILNYLCDEKVSNDKKKDAFSKNKRKVIKEISMLTDEEIINLLFNEKIINEVRNTVCDEIIKLGKKTDISGEEKYKRIILCFIRKYGKNTGMLINNLCPAEFKKKVIDLSFGSNLIGAIENNNISLEKKKVIIDLRLSEADAIELLKRNSINKELKEYIVDSRINTNDEIRDVLSNESITLEVKEYTAVHKVDMSNIFKLMFLSFNGEKELLFRVKARDLDDYLYSLNYKNILKCFTSYDIPNEFVKRIIEERGDVLLNGVRKEEKDILQKVLNIEKDVNVIELILKERRDTVFEICKQLYDFQLLNFLNKKYLPEDIKQYIINYYADELDDVIKKEKVANIEFFYLGGNSNVPEDIKLRLFAEHKEEFKEKFLKLSDREAIFKIGYGSFDDILKTYLIEIKINESNIFELLGRNYLDESIIELVFKTKGNIINNYISSLDVNDVFKLENLNVSVEMKNRIIREYKDTVNQIISEMDEDALFNYLTDKGTLIEIKNNILEHFGISDDNIKNCLLLMDSVKTKHFINNYLIIKDFIEKSEINFESFLQYGSGSKKHADWVDNIISVNDDKDFIRCKDYFFNHYYNEDNENENAVYIISNYLEFLDNYCKYKDLFLYLCDNNIDLSFSDKNNLKFLFSIKNVENNIIPKDLVDLKLFREYVFNEYREKFINSELNYDEKKKVFNDLLFNGSKEIFYNIGGSGALRTIKKDNSNSKYIGELVDELILYSRFIELVNDSCNEESLDKLFEYVFGSLDVFTNVNNLFSTYDKKILKLYEEDAMNNLTRLDKVKNIDGVLRYDLCKLYGGEVYDFSDKNYCLYGHVFSNRENIDDLLSGKSTGNSNFISVSPVSYRGQKFYWDRSELIFAYDRIPKGSFICSSINNMGSNGKITNNNSEVSEFNRRQRGILESSSVTENNSEALLYREGLKPCGLLLPGGRQPTKLEIEYHEKYGLPFIITQEVMKPIDGVKCLFDRDDSNCSYISNAKSSVQALVDSLTSNIATDKEDDTYTGREVAIISDCHSMYEPTLAALEDIRRHGISEIYSLGDNVGGGANPCEVFDLLEEYGVVSVSGNSEYYNHLGNEPFNYLTGDRIKENDWTERKLGALRINKLKLYPPSIDLFMGDQKLVLCHFGNDVRWDYGEHGTYAYQSKVNSGVGGKQFLYTNSDEAKKKITNYISSCKKGDNKARGYVSSKESPLFDGKRVTDYDMVIQGHVHFDMIDKVEDTDIITVRAVGMGYGKDDPNTACYYVLKERKDGEVDIIKRLVPFNKNNLVASLKTSDVPNKEHMLQYLITKNES